MARRAKTLNNFGQPSVGEAAAVTAFAEIPNPPGGYSMEEKLIWSQTCTALIEMGSMVLQLLDGVERYVAAKMVFREVTRDRKAKATTKLAAIEALRRAAVDIGLNVGSFSRVKVPKHKKEGGGSLVDSEIARRVA